MRTGYILAQKNYSFFGNQIRKLTKCEYSHVGVFVDEDNIVEAKMTGVAKTPFSTFEKYRVEGKIEFDLFKFKRITERKKWGMITFLNDQVGKRYDMLQMVVVGFMIAFNFNRKIGPFEINDAFTCSEIVAEAANSVGIQFSTLIDVDGITPADTLNSDLVAKVG